MESVLMISWQHILNNIIFGLKRKCEMARSRVNFNILQLYCFKITVRVLNFMDSVILTSNVIQFICKSPTFCSLHFF